MAVIQDKLEIELEVDWDVLEALEAKVDQIVQKLHDALALVAELKANGGVQ